MAACILNESVAAEGALGRLVKVNSNGSVAVIGSPFDALGKASAELEVFTWWAIGSWHATVLGDFPAAAGARARLQVVVALLGYSCVDRDDVVSHDVRLHCDLDAPHQDFIGSTKRPQFVAFAKKNHVVGSRRVLVWTNDQENGDEPTRIELRHGEVLVVNNLHLRHAIEDPEGIESALFDTEPDEGWLAF